MNTLAPFPSTARLNCFAGVVGRRPEGGRADHHTVEGNGDAGHAGRAEEDGGSLRRGRRALGDCVRGGPGHPGGDLRLLCEFVLSFVPSVNSEFLLPVVVGAVGPPI